jgi:hypothetical protein
MSLQIVEAVRSKYPTPLGGHHAAFLLEVAAATGKGLLIKTGGSRVTLPDGTTVSQDCLMEPSGIHYDILSDGEGAAKPAWDRVNNPDGTPLLVEPSRYYPVAPTAPVVTPPVETPPTPTVPVKDYTQDFKALSSILDHVADILQLMDGRLTNLENKQQNLDPVLEKLDKLDLIARNTFYKGKIFGANFTLNPEVRA